MCGEGERHVGSSGRGNEQGNDDKAARKVVTVKAGLEGVSGLHRRAVPATAAGRRGKGEVVLRERLLQARRDFLALRTGISTQELTAREPKGVAQASVL